LTARDTGPRLDLSGLARAISRPERFAPHDARFWDDPWIAASMLEAHLDPSVEAASAPPAVIDRRVEHLVGALGLEPGDRLLDLGCGPGLYAQRFARHGIGVTGLDLSLGSIAHARTAAAADGLAIEYRVADYTRDTFGGPYDAAVLVYLDFGVLDDAGRDAVLDRVRSALRPGGRFALDVHGRARPRPGDATVTVGLADGGFWRPGPHLVITTAYRYGQDVDLEQHAVVEPQGTVTVYRVWDRAYGLGDLRRLLGRHGLVLEAAWSDLDGTPWRRDSPVLAVVARRR
jgi:SAM-dependent methyltransferase